MMIVRGNTIKYNSSQKKKTKEENKLEQEIKWLR